MIDIAILTMFTDLKTISIYSVYSLVSNGLKQLINASITGISATIGQAYAKNDYNELNRKLDIYEYVVFLLVFIQEKQQKGNSCENNIFKTMPK